MPADQPEEDSYQQAVDNMPAPENRGVKANGLPWWFPDDFDVGPEIPPNNGPG